MEKNSLILFHGSQEPFVKPVFGGGNPRNDYGLGFYCTEDENLAKEWACPGERDGFANMYSLNIDGLSVLDLSANGMNVLNWLAILLENRDFMPASGLPTQARQFIMEGFLPEYRDYDLIKGWRADDSYFSFAKAFLNGTISIRQLEHAMRLGNLGEQIVLKSRAAFETIEFQLAIPCAAEVWNPRRSVRNVNAKNSYTNMLSSGPDSTNEKYIIDIIREGYESIQ